MQTPNMILKTATDVINTLLSNKANLNTADFVVSRAIKGLDKIGNLGIRFADALFVRKLNKAIHFKPSHYFPNE